MRKIDKSTEKILSTKYLEWLSRLCDKQHDGNYRYYYIDIVMNLLRCQDGICAYTERRICEPEYYATNYWNTGRHIFSKDNEDIRNYHLGELDHFDPEDKDFKHWNWENLFMIDAAINGIKSDKDVLGYLKPDLRDYSPEKYFEYEPETNRFIPNLDFENTPQFDEIKNMINHVLYLNHSVIINDRKNYINELIYRIDNGQKPDVFKFFTSVKWVLGLG